jgi:hypothetical protein
VIGKFGEDLGSNGCCCNDERVWLQRACLFQPRLDWLCDVMPLYIWIQLLEQVTCVFRPIASKMFFLQEEVDAQICLADYGRVLNCEVADAG